MRTRSSSPTGKRDVDKEKRKKLAVSIAAGILLSLLYVMIFSFSAQDGESSGSLSQEISKTCVEIADNLTGRHWTEPVKKELAEYFEHPLRKMAHFSEYTGMGILVYILWRPWVKRGKKLYGIVIAWVFLSAGADEFHQLFVQGRYGSFADVLLDTSGGACGAAIAVFLEKMRFRIKVRIKKRKPRHSRI